MKSDNSIVQKFLDGDMDAGGTIAELEHEVFKLLKANAELAKLTANMIEFLTEVSYKPYSDSDALSLLESLRTRASVILQDIGKDEPLTLTDLPRPWSEGNMQKAHLTPLAVDGATVAEFCECGISIESHTGVYCIFRPATKA